MAGLLQNYCSAVMHAMHAMHVKQNASADEVLMMSDVGGKVSHIQ
jgi:hypothetical protein